jgi:hypothetical protein
MAYVDDHHPSYLVGPWLLIPHSNKQLRTVVSYPTLVSDRQRRI